MKITFNIEYFTHWGEELFLMLNNDMGSVVKMNYTPGAIWTLTLNISDTTRELRYRYLVKENNLVTRVERCECHTLSLAVGIEDYNVVDWWSDDDGGDLSGDLVARLFDRGKNGRRIATWVDVLSLRSGRDLGAGDLGDLKQIIRWAVSTGQDVVALHSLSDRQVVDGWIPLTLSKQVRANAIDPVYINLSAMSAVTDRKVKARFQRAGMSLNTLDTTSVEDVRGLKLEYCRAVFDEEASSVTRTAAFRTFVAGNLSWLAPYAAQSLLRQIKESADTSSWGIYDRYDAARVERFLKARRHETLFVYYLQYLLRQQLMEAASHAHSMNISLTCDMMPRQVRSIDVREPWLNERAIKQRIAASGAIALIPLRDWMTIEDGFASRVSRATGWRLPVMIEELIAASTLNQRIRQLVSQS